MECIINTKHVHMIKSKAKKRAKFRDSNQINRKKKFTLL